MLYRGISREFSVIFCTLYNSAQEKREHRKRRQNYFKSLHIRLCICVLYMHILYMYVLYVYIYVFRFTYRLHAKDREWSYFKSVELQQQNTVQLVIF